MATTRGRGDRVEEARRKARGTETILTAEDSGEFTAFWQPEQQKEIPRQQEKRVGRFGFGTGNLQGGAVSTKRVRRTTEITMETAEYIFARKTAQPIVGWCESCAKEVAAFGFDEASQTARVGEGELLLWIADRRLHVVRTSRGSAICGESLQENCSSQSQTRSTI